MKTYDDFFQYIDTLAGDFKASDYNRPEDYADDVAYRNEYVAFPALAFELLTIVRRHNFDLFEAGENMAKNEECFFTTLDAAISNVCFGVIWIALVNAIYKENDAQGVK